jgi:anti-sigma regulatory factor (Ser/Thr protein kinase)
VEFAVEGSTPPQLLLISVRDEGPGIADLAHVLSDNTGWPPEWVSDSWAGTA